MVQRANVPTLSSVLPGLSQLTYWIVLGGICGSVPLQRYWPEGSSMGVEVELIPPQFPSRGGAETMPLLSVTLSRFSISCCEVTLVRVGQFKIQYEVSILNVELPRLGMFAIGIPRREEYTIEFCWSPLTVSQLP